MSNLLCINCDHNLTTILAGGGYDPTEVCSLCVEEEAQRLATLDGEDFETVLELVWDDALSVHGDFWRDRV